MVLAERNTESIRNGRRGPSPNGNNGNCSPTSSSDEENCKLFFFLISLKYFKLKKQKKTILKTKYHKKKLQHQKKLEVNHQRQNLVNMRVRLIFL